MGASGTYPRQVTSLVIVETLAKSSALEPMLQKAGLRDSHILVCPSAGDGFPASLPPIGVAADLEVSGRRVLDDQSARLVRSWVNKATKVYVASDPDARGDSFASDVSALFPTNANIFRVRLRGLHFDGVVAAFSRPEPIRPQYAWPHLLRVVLDRCARYVINRRLGIAESRVDVGVAEIALAALLKKVGPGTRELVISLPSVDNAGPFIASTAIGINDHEAMRLREFSAHAAEEGVRVRPAESVHADGRQPWNSLDAMVEIGRITDWAPDLIDRSLRRLYESGRLSYPFGDQRTLSSSALTCLARIAEDNGFRFDPSHVPAYARGGIHDHEALYPVSQKVDITTPIALLSVDDAVLSLITRNQLSCGQPHVRQTADVSSIPGWAKEFTFERVAPLWLTPVQNKPFSSKLVLPDPDRRLVELMRDYAVAAPEGVVAAIEKFNRLKLSDLDGYLSERGGRLLASCPAQLRDTDLLLKTEELIRASSNWESLGAALKDLLSSLGLAPEIMPLLKPAITDRGG